MRHRNNVKQLGRTYSHRKAMFSNMVTSLFKHERIVTTKQKAKELKKLSEKLISRARKNLELTDEAKKLHNKREVMKVVKDRAIVKKLFEDIAPRNKDRNGGYTRILLLDNRPGDAAEKAIIELVERTVVKEAKKEKEDKKTEKAEKSGKKEKKKSEKKDKTKDKE